MATDGHEISSLMFDGEDLKPPSLDDFGDARRLRILRDDRRARFMPSGTTELNTAFENMFHAHFQNASPATILGWVREFHMKRSKARDPAKVMEQGDNAVRRVTYDYAAYASQARQDRRWLAFAEGQLKESRLSGARFDSVAEYFAGTPAIQGPGQLVRYLDAKEAVDHPDGVAAGYAFQAGFEKKPGGTSVLRDPYTASQLSRDMAGRQLLVLSTLSMAELGQELGAAQVNEGSRQQYWSDQLRGALQDEVAQPIAQAALVRLVAR